MRNMSAVALCAAVLAVGCGRSGVEGNEAGCLLLGWGVREFKEDTVRVEFEYERLVGFGAGDTVRVWSTEENLGSGPRRLLTVSSGTSTEPSFIIYSEPGGPAEGAIFVDAGMPACASLNPEVTP